MSQTLRVALLQERDHGSPAANLDAIEAGMREAAAAGAELVLLQELHNGPYFCQHEDVGEFDRGEAIPGASTERIGKLAGELKLVVVASASSSASTPLNAATNLAVSVTNAGSHFCPRCGTGARKGESVSTSIWSAGSHLAVACSSCAFLNVTIPDSET